MGSDCVLLSHNLAAILKNTCFRFRSYEQATINQIGKVPNILLLFVMHQYIGAAKHLALIYKGAADIEKIREILKVMQDVRVSSPFGATGKVS